MRWRKAWLRLAGLLALAGCGAAAPPNVVLVSVDTLRADAVGAYGSRIPTPALDRLAGEGVLFESALAPAPETAPSHASLLTGLEIGRHGVLRNGVPLAASAATLAEAFRDAGYATAAFVSSFVLDPRFGWDRGFQRYDAEFPKRGESLRHRVDFAREHRFEGYDRAAPATTARALAWLEAAPEPFFLFLHYFDPHAPYGGAPELTSRVPEDWVQRRARRWLPLLRREIPGLTLDELALMIRHYHAEVMLVDAALGRVLGALEDRELRDRTLVAVTADHGEGLGQHGSLGHAHNLSEEQVRVPLILSWPAGLPRGRRVAEPVGLIDVAPTLAELASLPLAGVDGRSLAGDLRSGEEPEARPLWGRRRAYPRPVDGHRGQKFFVRDGRWKYIRASEGPDELYDLAEDPREQRDLRALRPERVARMGAILDARRAAAPEAPATALPEEVRRGLEALGYADEGEVSTADEGETSTAQ